MSAEECMHVSTIPTIMDSNFPEGEVGGEGGEIPLLFLLLVKMGESCSFGITSTIEEALSTEIKAMHNLQYKLQRSGTKNHSGNGVSDQR